MLVLVSAKVFLSTRGVDRTSSKHTCFALVISRRAKLRLPIGQAGAPFGETGQSLQRGQ